MQLFLVAILALIFGSFASFVTYRLGVNQTLLAAHSICTNCKNKLKIKNLIPLFSYLFQKGKCSFCEEKISSRYFLIELSFLISFLTIFFALNSQINLTFILYLVITAILLCMIIIDLEHYFIPNSLQYFLAFFAIILLLSFKKEGLVLANIKAGFIYLLFAIFLKIFFYFLAKVDALGIDDVKFFFIAGLVLGEKNFLTFAILSGIFGVIFGAIWQKLKNDETFPFAPAICTSCFVTMIFGKKINIVDLFGVIFF